MHHRLIRRPLLAALAAACVGACGGGGGDDGVSQTPPTSPPASPGDSTNIASDVVLQLRRGAQIASIAADHQLTVVDQFGRRPIWRLRASAGADVDALVQALRGDARVQFAERNFEGETPERRHHVVWAFGGDANAYASQWAPSAMRLPEAHTRSTGAGIRVAILDTGVDLAHPALAGRLARTSSGSLLGRDFVDDDADPSETGVQSDAGYGHGTHVAGLVSLTAPAAALMPVRVLDAKGRGNLWVLSDALLWAVDPDGNPDTDDGAHVINLSLGSTQPTTLLKTAVALADCDFDDDDDEFEDPGFDDDRDRCSNKFGAAVMSAAGNAGNTSELQYPAAETVPGALAVTASTESRQLAPFANRGGWVQIAAPGQNIISTFPGGGYATWSGTSMASPLAAGTAALVLATRANPRDWLPLDVTSRLVARSAALCGTSLRQVDASAAVSDASAPDQPCP